MRKKKLGMILAFLLCSVLITNTGLNTAAAEYETGTENAAVGNSGDVTGSEAGMALQPMEGQAQEEDEGTQKQTIEQTSEGTDPEQKETGTDGTGVEGEGGPAPGNGTDAEQEFQPEAGEEEDQPETDGEEDQQATEGQAFSEPEMLKLQLEQIKELGIDLTDYYGSFGLINETENRKLICDTAMAYKKLKTVIEFAEILEEGAARFTPEDKAMLDGSVEILYRCLENGGLVLYDDETNLPVIGYPNTENIENPLRNPRLRAANNTYDKDSTTTRQIDCGINASTIQINNGVTVTVDLSKNEAGKAGIRVPANGTLTISGNGTLIVKGANNNQSDYAAGSGIGGGGSGNGNKITDKTGGYGITISIYSGNVYAEGSVTGNGNSDVSHGGSGIGGGGFTTNSGRGSKAGSIVIGRYADVTAIGGAVHNVTGNGDRGMCGSGIGVAGENGKMSKADSGTLTVYQGAVVKTYSRGELVTKSDNYGTSGHNEGDAIGTNSDTKHGEHLAIDFGRGNGTDQFFMFVQKDNDIGNNYVDENNSGRQDNNQNGYKYENTGSTANILMQTFYDVGHEDTYHIWAQSSATGEWFDGGTTPKGYASYAFIIGDNETTVTKPASADKQDPYYIVTATAIDKTTGAEGTTARQLGKWNYGETPGTSKDKFIVVNNQVTDYVVELGADYVPEEPVDPEKPKGTLTITKIVSVKEGLLDTDGKQVTIDSSFVTDASFSIRLERLDEADNSDGNEVYIHCGDVILEDLELDPVRQAGSKSVTLNVLAGTYRIRELVPANYKLLGYGKTADGIPGGTDFIVIVPEDGTGTAFVFNQLVNISWLPDKDVKKNILKTDLNMGFE